MGLLRQVTSQKSKTGLVEKYERKSVFLNRTYTVEEQNKTLLCLLQILCLK